MKRKRLSLRFRKFFDFSVHLLNIYMDVNLFVGFGVLEYQSGDTNKSLLGLGYNVEDAALYVDILWVTFKVERLG